MATTKMTKRDSYNALLNLSQVRENAQLVEFINHELDLLTRKNSAEKKPTAQQLANDGIKAAILAFLRADPQRLVTISEMVKQIPECADLTGQRVSALVSQLKAAGEVERIEDKRKAYFRAVENEVEG